jgi:metallo-beta-lactamase family protein
MGSSKSDFYFNIEASSNEVTGNCIILEIVFPNKVTKKIGIDCGSFNENEYYDLNWKFISEPKSINHFILTHAHADHIGLLPRAVAQGFSGNVYCTQFTKDLLKLPLENVCEIFDIKKNKHTDKHKRLFSNEDVDSLFSKLIGCNYNKKVPIDENISFKLLGNGHVGGAACILLSIRYPKRKTIHILFTGDYAADNKLFKVPKLPKGVLKHDLYIVQESTYGATNSSEIEKNFEVDLTKALLENKTVIIPAFAFGRSQEIESFIRKMQKEKNIPKDIKVYLDGSLAEKFSSKFLDNNEYLKRSAKNFIPFNFKIIDYTNRNEVLANNEPKIIICTSGMCTFGPSRFYIRNLLNNENVTFLLPGYLAKGTLGREILEATYGEFFTFKDGLQVRKLAQVIKVNDFSSHAKADELIAFLKQFPNIKAVFLTHGSTITKEKYFESVKLLTNVKDVIILCRDKIIRADSYRILKSFNKAA